MYIYIHICRFIVEAIHIHQSTSAATYLLNKSQIILLTEQNRCRCSVWGVGGGCSHQLEALAQSAMCYHENILATLEDLVVSCYLQWLATEQVFWIRSQRLI